MAKYHINPETGNPGVCRATKQCRFGSANEHYGSKDEARAAYERSQGPQPVEVPKEDLMHHKQVAHKVGDYLVSTRPVGSIGAKPGQINVVYETIVVDDNDEDGLPVFEKGSYDETDGPINHAEAIKFAQDRLRHPIKGFPLQMIGTAQSTDVVGQVGADGFVASTYPSHEDFVPKPVRAVVTDSETGKTGFIAARPRQGYKTHVMRDNPRWRQGMGLGKLIVYGRSICGEAGKASSMIAGGHNDPTSPSKALADASAPCEACAKKFADPDFN